MMKTTEPIPDKPTPPPSDAQIVKEFIAEAEVFNEQAKTVSNERLALSFRAAADTRQILADRLQAGKIARAEYVKDATERFAEAMNQAGRSVADFLNNAYKKAEDRADRDRQ